MQAPRQVDVSTQGPVQRLPSQQHPRVFEIAIAAVTTLLHLAFANVYGIFRDELYYLVSADRLAWGYVEHPPLVAWLAWLVRGVLGESLLAIRLVPALLAGALVLVVARLAGVMGGGRGARALAALAAASMPFNLALFSYFSMNAIDFLVWGAVALAAALMLRDDEPRGWLTIGVLVAVGLLAKISVVFLVGGLIAGLFLGRRFALIFSRWKFAGGVIAALAFAPYLIWQAVNGWPFLEFASNASRFKNVALDPLSFLGEQMLGTGPTVLLWLPGLAALLVGRWARPWRPLGFAFLAVLAFFLVTNAKPYYLAPAYGMLVAAGAVALERIARDDHRSAQGQKPRARGWILPATAAIVLVLGAVIAPLARPILPVESFLRYSAAIGITPSSGERQEQGALPQFFADRHGWRELARTVGEVAAALPPEDRAMACVFGQNYGEAGAIDFFREEFDLPPAISGHNSYWLWGPGACTGEVLIVIGGDREDLERDFASVVDAALHRAPLAMPYESELPIYVVRGLRAPLRDAWPTVKRYI